MYVYNVSPRAYVAMLTAQTPDKPYIIQEPRNVTVVEGGTARFECKILSDAHPHLQWLRHFKVNGSYTDANDSAYIKVMQVSSVSRSRQHSRYINVIVDKFTCIWATHLMVWHDVMIWCIDLNSDSLT